MHIKFKSIQILLQTTGILKFINIVTFVGSLIAMSLLYESVPKWSFLPEPENRALQNDLREIKGIFPSQTNVPFDEYMLNVSLSNKIPLDRDLADERPLECMNRRYGDLPKATVIIPFHDESWSMLLRTATSVALRTPSSLLDEVLLVDDASTHEYLGKPLDFYINAMPKFRVLRRPKREGLIRARLAGAAEAKGKVLVFLDAHVEVTRGWLEPLLAAINRNRSVLAIPHIDTIIPETIRYELWEPPPHGGFSWSMDYVWKAIPAYIQASRASAGSPIPTATTIGCAFAVDKAFFYELGTFDEDLYIWGGENLELSFKTWMCGGAMYIYPCSRVGHMFRTYLPYSFPKDVKGADVISKNYQRVVDVWMDDYAKYYYAFKPRIPFTGSELRSLEKRQKLRKDLKCHSFRWYLENVIPEMFIPWDNATYQGQLKNLGSWYCLAMVGSTGQLRVSVCSEQAQDQYFYLVKGMLMMNHTHCVIVTPYGVKAMPCKEKDLNFHWQMALTDSAELKENMLIRERNRDLGMLVNMGYTESKICLTQVTSYGAQWADAQSCDNSQKFQYWSFTYKMKLS